MPFLPAVTIPRAVTAPSGRPAATTGEKPFEPSRWWGVALAAVLGLLAWRLGRVWPLIGGPVLGIVAGLVWRNVFGVPVRFYPGIAFTSRQVLKWSVIGLGFGLSLGDIVHTGAASLVVTLSTLLVAFVSAWGLGRWIGVHGAPRILIGVGTAICGGSAIAAMAPILDAREQDTAMAISTIFLFNVVAVLVFPALGHWMGLSDGGFGLWAGTAINDTSSVVAAGYSYSVAAGDTATIVKLVRATFIVPVCVGFALWIALRDRREGGRVSLVRIFPWFILGFLAASAVRTLGLLPDESLALLHLLSQFMIVMALTAVGLGSDLRSLVRTGARPLALGLGVWIAVAVASLVVQALLNGL